MERQIDYTLGRIDKWYTDRYRRNYTPEVAARFIGLLKDGLAGTGTLEVLTEQGFFDTLSCENLHSSNCISFSDIFFGLETNLGYVAKPENRSEIPEGVWAEYVQPAVEDQEKLKRIVDRLRRRADEIFPDDLSNDDVKKYYFDGMDGVEGLIEFSLHFIDNSLVALDLGFRHGEVTQDHYQRLREYWSGAKKALAYFVREVFKDV